MSEFLPEGYDKAKEKEEKQSGSSYMRFEEGENKFRILTKPIVGWEWWVDDDGDIVERGTSFKKGNKPVRIDMETNMVAEQFENAKLFWAMLVWNYQEEKAQILEITQSSIRSEIEDLIKDKDWGDPTGYDIVVERFNEEIVRYTVRPKPHKKFDKKGKDIPKVNLKALFENEDPYNYEIDHEDEEIDIEEIMEDLDGEVA